MVRKFRTIMPCTAQTPRMGADADDHGSVSGGVNLDGWLFMQRALENIAPGVTNGNKQVVILGSSTGDALTAANSAFNLSSLVAAGWTVTSVDGVANITSFLSGGLSGAGIIMMDSGANVGGGITTAEQAALAGGASFINTFVGNGGGLFSQANEYTWLSALLPTLTVIDFSDTGLALTASGSAAFPGLTNADLSAGPYHERFGNLGGLSVLATGIGTASTFNVIIGSAGGSITNPEPPPVGAIPEPSTYALMLAGLGAIGWVGRRRRDRS
jgi:PEP-CTERM motif